MIRTLYLCGSITKDREGYVRKFAAAAAVLRLDGFDVISPVELDDPEHAAEALDDPYGERYEELLARDLGIIERDDVDAVVVLPDWHESRGAWREVDHAMMLDKPVLEYPNLNPAPVYEERARLRELKDSGATLGKPDANPSLCGKANVAQSVADTLRYEEDAPLGVGTNTVRTFGACAGEVRVTDPETGGQKGTKPQRWELVPMQAVARIAEVYAYGAQKYDDHNWRKGYAWSLSFGAMLRHLAAWQEGENADPESGLSHLAHAGFHVLALLYYAEHFPAKDDRPSV